MFVSGITLSTLGVGQDADVQLLEAMAQIGGGRFYPVTDPASVTSIFMKELYTVGRAAIVEEEFVPVAGVPTPMLRGVDAGGLPPLLGYDATVPRDLASVHLSSHKDEPVLASWQYGLGRSVAFTSDAKNRWAAKWVGSPEFRKVWSQIARYAIRSPVQGGVKTAVSVSGGEGRVIVDAVDTKGEFANFLKFTGTATGASPQSETLAFEQVAPGRYMAPFKIPASGDYVLTVARTSSDGQTEVTNTAICVPYSPEYAAAFSNDALLSQIAEATGGRVMSGTDNPFDRTGSKVPVKKDVWPFLLVLGIVAFPVDVAIRKLAIRKTDVRIAYDWVVSRLSMMRTKPAPEPERQATMSALLSRKQELRAKPPTDARKAVPAPARQELKVEVPAVKPPVQPDAQPKPSPQPPAAGGTAHGGYAQVLEAKKKAMEKMRRGRGGA
jgi:Ca-activated chloride channel family protein